MPNISRFRPERVPPADVFFHDNVEKFRARGRRATGLCPFHEDTHPSLSIDLERGLFHCFACGAGGDVIRFVELRDKCSPKQAAITLGCWDGHASAYKPRPTVLRRFLVLDYAIDGVSYRAEVQDEPRNDLQRLRWTFHEAEDRLKELREGSTEIYEGEGETQWAILSLSWALIQMEVGR